MYNPSHICSKYYKWFVEMGYPQLDINQYIDGSWSIIEYENSPLIPSMTRWRMVLGVMKNIEISYGFVKKYVEEIDLQKKAIWDRAERASAEADKVAAEKEAHQYEYADKAFEIMRRNPDLMERIAENGLSEMSLDKIAEHVPHQEIKAMNKVMLAR